LAKKASLGPSERRFFSAQIVKTRPFPGIIAAMFIIKKKLRRRKYGTDG
jgi:hypothetical protein